MFIFVGLGNGLIDAAWCSFIGNLANTHEMSGILQACYALGATVAPLIATAMISSGGLGWYAFYYVMVSILFFPLDFPASRSRELQLTTSSERLGPRQSNFSPQPLRSGTKQGLCIYARTRPSLVPSPAVLVRP